MRNQKNQYKNLAQYQNLSAEKRKKNASLGGKASGETRRRKKVLRQCLSDILTRPVTIEEIQQMLEKHQVENCYENAMCLAIIKKAVEGDVKAFEVVRDTIGEKPTERVENSQDKPFEVNIRVVD